ncbi:regulator of chromosome condensation-like [Physella acuta]|uniref:regulator of chromosome condensation-like n=1 Tax=Physella acuta TaxID=109671 RepID=UPI0027DE0531|nr:regulator of chromosome condensation-like [Physella acuta]XP_059172277.1 regulator of chromosome condensation-like [Physella acuta]
MPQGKKRTLEKNNHNGTKPKRLKVTHDSHGSVHGVVLACGQGDVGQLGLGVDITERTRLAYVEIPDPVIQVCAGGMHTVCLTNTGQVFTFGCNDEGALGRDTSVEGSDAKPGKVNIPAPIVMVTAGDSHTAALTDDGRVYAWGNFRDANGSMGLTTNGIEKTPFELIQEEVIVKMVSGSDHLVCLTDRGDLLSLGCAEQGQLGRIAECFATRGGRKGLDMILSPGRVKVKRFKTRKMAQFCDVWAGAYTTFAKEKETGDIYAWGLNNYYQLGFNDMVNRFIPERVTSFSEKGSWSMLSGGQHHTVALDSKGKVYTIGREDYGRLGLDKNCGEKQEPTLVPALQDFTCVNVAAGGCVSFAVTNDGTLYSWGMGSNNQLGSGDDEDQFVPTKVAGKQLESRSAVMVSAGGQHTVVLAKSIENGDTNH